VLSASAAAQELAARPCLEWETVLCIYSLPPACSENPAFAPLFVAAAAALQQQLGDLDAAWLDAAAAERLRTLLPFAALVALLADDRTRVATENTVVYTACAWLAQHGGGTPEQQDALADAIRIPHVTPLYLAGVTAQCGWVTRSIRPHELHLASAFAAAPEGVQDRMLRNQSMPFSNREAWQLPKRPASGAPKDLEIIWEVPLAQLQSLHEQARSGAVARAESPVHVFEGLEWDLRLHAQLKPSPGSYGGSRGVMIGLYAFAHPPPGCKEVAMVSAHVKVEVGRLARGFSLMPFALGSGPGASEGRGFADVFGLGVREAWDEAAWRGAGLVGEGGRVRVGVVIREVA